MIHELIGWYGALALIGAFALVSFNFVDTNGLVYQLLNLTGALGIVYHSFHKRDFQPGVLNIVWALIALIALWQIVL